MSTRQTAASKRSGVHPDQRASCQPTPGFEVSVTVSGFPITSDTAASQTRPHSSTGCWAPVGTPSALRTGLVAMIVAASSCGDFLTVRVPAAAAGAAATTGISSASARLQRALEVFTRGKRRLPPHLIRVISSPTEAPAREGHDWRPALATARSNAARRSLPLFHIGAEAIQAARPRPPVAVDPARRVVELRRAEPALPRTTDLRGDHQIDRLEDADMLLDAIEREAERLGQLADRGGSAGEPFEDAPARRVRKREERSI